MNTRSQTKKMVALNMTKNKVVITRLGVVSQTREQEGICNKIRDLNPEGRSVTRHMTRCAKALHYMHVIILPNTFPQATNRSERVSVICHAYQFINTHIYIRECFQNYHHINSVHKLIRGLPINIDMLTKQIAQYIVECVPGDDLHVKYKRLEAELKCTTKMLSSIKYN